MPEIIVIGNFVVDLIGKPLDRLPERGRLLILDTLETHSGGNGPNTAGALGRLGGDVAVVGRVGEDLYGRFLLERLNGWGVQTDLVIRDPDAATGITVVAVDHAGERSFLHHFGANAQLAAADLPWESVADARFLHLSAFFVLPGLDTPDPDTGAPPAAALLAEARKRGLTTSLDLCWDRTGGWMKTLRPCLPHVDWMLPSEDEAQALTGRDDPKEMAATLLEAGCGAVVIKLGEQGCYYCGPQGELWVPAYQVPVQETTGAGDCFVAGFLLALGRGWDLERSLRFGNACGARAVSAIGAVTGLGEAAAVALWAEAQLHND
jgi:sugar/nucleoside kinase (ribokinase family)